ncbi:MAG: UTP--glucose-1-phosphate uridylyltransferase GalU [Alphaproteobacteria bacterium]|nr:UTP--glucose-1-phosphate uridylyltransferase GalU [Alphaproteobacteria bacterium]
MAAKVRKAVFPVAGQGTRFLPATKVVPKEMLPIVDKPLIQYAVEEAKEAGIEEFIFVDSRGKTMIANHFDYNPELEDALFAKGKHELLKKVQESTLPSGLAAYTRQEKALGLGHAIWCARKFIANEPFAVLLPDDLFFYTPNCLKQLVDEYERTGGYLLAVHDIPVEDTNKYGVLKIAKDDGLTVTAEILVEKPKPEEAPSNVAVAGRYILSPEIFEALEKKAIGSGGEIQLTDAITSSLGKVTCTGLRFKGKRFDCGTMEGWLEANLYVGLQREDSRDLLTAYLEKLGFSRENKDSDF